MKIQYLKRPRAPALAYVYTPPRHYLAGEKLSLLWPVMFLGGYRSDMTGTKASFLEQQCMARGQAFLRFDYSGHGASEGDFNEGTIGQWSSDALAVFDAVITGPCVLVGSSMGGWMALLLARARPDLIKGVIGIAAVPDFTEELYGRMNADAQRVFSETGFYNIPSDDSAEPYHFTRTFYTEAKAHLLLSGRHPIHHPLHLLQGKQDRAVPWRTAEKIAACFEGPATQITYIEDGDHRLSRPQDLEVLDSIVRSICAYT